MIYNYVLAQDRKGRLWLKRPGLGRAMNVCTASDAAKRLGRSRRQIYRQIEAGQLPTVGKLGKEILIPENAVSTRQKTPLSRPPLPRRLQAHFPEYEIRKLNASRDATLIVTRILDLGSMDDLRWLFRRYSDRQIEETVAQDGARLLSKRGHALWTRVFKIRPKRSSSWRQKEAPWFQK